MTKTVLIRTIAGLTALNAAIFVFVDQHRVHLISEILTILLIAVAVVVWARSHRASERSRKVG
jgi:hypothetical protein